MREHVKACVLIKDFELFSNGDLTENGERGINMSGGPKLMYVVVDGYPFVRLLNLFGEIDCSNPGLNKVVAPIIKLKDVKVLLQPHTILVIAAGIKDFFTKVSSDLSFASKIGGVLVESGSNFQQNL